MKTIIDILKKGNQELFHSAMIGWLLDPKGEHGYGTRFLEGFVNIVCGKNPPLEFAKAIKDPSTIKVATEETSGRSRFDIKVDFGSDKNSIIIENKTKSIGDTSQLKRYEKECKRLVALGLTEMSFETSLPKEVTLVTYRKILEMIEGLPPSSEPNFQVLIDHYRKFLSRELELLDNILKFGRTGNIDTRNQIVESCENTQSNENDIRFLYLHYLEGFRRLIAKNNSEVPWKKWKSYKNSISGVWLANPVDRDFEKHIELHSWIRDINCQKNLWLHIELWKGGCLGDDKVGEIQLRCSSNDGQEAIRKAFKYNLKDKLVVRDRVIGKNSSTFYLVKKELSIQDLPYEQLAKTILSFSESFGKITD